MIPKAGFWARISGSDKPDGTVSNAWSILRHGDIASGRELLRRICKHEPDNFDAHILFSLELMRPPEDNRKSAQILQAADPYGKTCETQSFFVIAGISQITAEGSQLAIESSVRAHERTPRSVHGSAVSLLADVFLSDLMIQGFCRPEGSRISGHILQPALKGVANLLHRDHQEALAQFRCSPERAQRVAANYETELGFPLTVQQQQRIVSALLVDCAVGEALTLRDLGEFDQAKAKWQFIAQTYPNYAPAAVSMLIDECELESKQPYSTVEAAKPKEEEFRVLDKRTPSGGLVFWVNEIAKVVDEHGTVNSEFVNRMIMRETKRLPFHWLVAAGTSEPNTALKIKVLPCQEGGCEVHIDHPAITSDEHGNIAIS